MGGTQDPRHAGKHPELKDKVITPDVLLQPHSASLQLAFHEGSAFAAQHGSWNRSLRTGYKVIRVPFKKDGTADGLVRGLPDRVRHRRGLCLGPPRRRRGRRRRIAPRQRRRLETIWRVRRATK